MPSRRIHRLEVSNFRGLAFADVTVGSAMVKVVGYNSAGKSSVLNAIAAAVATRAQFVKPIKDGWKQATIRLHIGGEDVDTVVIRTFTESEEGKVTTKLEMQTPSGVVLKRPADLLKQLVGDGPLDPLKFMMASDRDQLVALRRFVPGIDFEVVARKRLEVFESRTLVGRDRDRLKGSLDTLIEEIRQAPPEGRSQQDILADIQARNAVEQTHNRWQQEVSGHRQRVVNAQAHAQVLSHQVDQLREQLQAAERAAAEASDALDVLIDRRLPAEPSHAVPAEPLKAEMDRAIAHQAFEHKRTELKNRQSDHDAEVVAYTRMTAEIEAMDKAVRDAIAATKMPVEGLTISEDSVELDGVPFEAANRARRIAASVGVTMATVPKDGLRVLWIEDSSLLDVTSLKLMEDLAIANDFQVWLERVSDGTTDGTSIVVEAGEARSADTWEV